MSLNDKTLEIATLMQQSGIKFGTSGARGLVEDMTDEVCYAYTLAFIQHLEHNHDINDKQAIAIAGDYRPSTTQIMTAIGMAIHNRGYKVIHCGYIPTPALAHYALGKKIPCIMVTGSHIPDDRNGIKFYTSTGEILKDDEQSICSQTVSIPAQSFSATGNTLQTYALPTETSDAYKTFVKRYLDFFPPHCLHDKQLIVYEHSTVARKALVDILEGLGATVTPLGYSDHFLPVDTEAIRPEDIQLAQQWANTHPIDAIISADGDGDRPLISDEHGHWLRGDIAGILCAHYLQADAVATPVSCNSAVEKSHYFKSIKRTRIGSPFVIEAMHKALQEKHSTVVGYEANGGFLTASDISIEERTLTALPTRDAIIVPLTILLLSIQCKKSIAALLNTLPACFTFSGRLKNFPTSLSQAKLAPLQTPDMEKNIQAASILFTDLFGVVQQIDTTDGVRISFNSEEVVHLRPSGNAPELRCYNEAATAERAELMNQQCMQLLATWK